MRTTGMVTLNLSEEIYAALRSGFVGESCNMQNLYLAARQSRILHLTWLSLITKLIPAPPHAWQYMKPNKTFYRNRTQFFSNLICHTRTVFCVTNREITHAVLLLVVDQRSKMKLKMKFLPWCELTSIVYILCDQNCRNDLNCPSTTVLAWVKSNQI